MSVFNTFDQWVRKKLASSPLLRADETGINIEGKRNWLYNTSNVEFSFFYPIVSEGAKRWTRPGYCRYSKGILCYDH